MWRQLIYGSVSNSCSWIETELRIQHHVSFRLAETSTATIKPGAVFFAAHFVVEVANRESATAVPVNGMLVAQGRISANQCPIWGGRGSKTPRSGSGFRPQRPRGFSLGKTEPAHTKPWETAQTSSRPKCGGARRSPIRFYRIKRPNGRPK